MPIYEYRCTACSHEFERLIRPGDAAPACPQCRATELERLLSLAATICWEWCRQKGDDFALAVAGERPTVVVYQELDRIPFFVLLPPGVTAGVMTCLALTYFGLPVNPEVYSDVYYIDKLPVAMDPLAIIAAIAPDKHRSGALVAKCMADPPVRLGRYSTRGEVLPSSSPSHVGPRCVCITCPAPATAALW